LVNCRNEKISCKIFFKNIERDASIESFEINGKMPILVQIKNLENFKVIKTDQLRNFFPNIRKQKVESISQKKRKTVSNQTIMQSEEIMKKLRLEMVNFD
jgi:hypothetical protein